MDIIIHGKPLAGSARASQGTDGPLAQKIVNEFFEGMSSIHDNEALYVDARNWKGLWFGVYTFMIGKNIKDTAGRDSFFAITLIVPQSYYCLVSEVYSYLKQIIDEVVIGGYISPNRQYVVQNFDDPRLFDKICARLRSKDFVNLEETFDSNFKPQAELGNETYCNLLDCDSKAFVRLLQSKGRVIVTNSADTKDALASRALDYAQQLRQVNNKLLEREKTIGEQKAHISKLENAISDANKNASSQVKELNDKVKELQKANRELTEEQQQLKATYDNIALNVQQIVKELNVSTSTSVSNPGNDNQIKGKLVEWAKRHQPALNTLLLSLLTLLLLFLSFKGYFLNKEVKTNSAQTTEALSNTTLQKQVDSLTEKLQTKENEIEALKSERDQLQQKIEDFKQIKEKASSLIGTSQKSDKEKIIVKQPAKGSEDLAKKPAADNPIVKETKVEVEPKKEEL